jgi:PAS domain S-box-containing protein
MGFLANLLPASIKRRLISLLGGASDDRFARVFHASPDWIVLTRLSDGLIVDVNQGFVTISGFAAKDVLGHKMTEFDVWAQPEQRKILVDELMANGFARDTLVQLRRRDGAVRDCMVNATLLALQGDTHSHAVWIARDVTEQNAIHEQFKAAFQLTPDFMSISRLSDGTYVEVNAAFEQITGLTRENTLGRTSIEVGVWHDPKARDALVHAFKTQGQLHEYFILINARNGQVREALVNAATFETRGERYMIALLRDVTEQRRIQEEIRKLNTELEARVTRRTADLERANQELHLTLVNLQTAKDQLVQSEKLAALGALVAGVAHELNTPIGNGLTVASSLQYRVQEFDTLMGAGMKRSDLATFVDNTRQAADIITRNLARAGALITSFKQVAVDQTSSQRRPFSLTVLVSEILLTLQPSIRKSGCTVNAEIADDIQMDSYPGPLGQVITNLINNAMVHGYREMPPGLITISAQCTSPNQLRLEIRDSGHGILKSDLTHVFEPFFTTRMGQGGSGLGLHIVHNLVTSVLGGQITVQSEAGRGAAFTLVLPTSAPGQTGHL